MTGSLDIPDSAPSGASSPWATLRRLIGLDRSVVEAAHPAAAPHLDAAQRSTVAEPLEAVQPAAAGPVVDVAPAPHGALGLFRPTTVRTHAELFMSERTGDWIRVGCTCSVGADHWHAARAG
ncbi:hypothetical protein ACFOYW_02770 [Gryllotalpicola reticulitermitis]|uniref:Uncharacterized protein n=1 Tax=Gryllotalpicola reticulitermitis TaxID=1184153 RepID=A0ABV8Q2V1_9MICO